MSDKYPLHTLPPDEVGQRFARFRELAGLSIGQTAKLLNVSREEIEKTENGHYEEVESKLIIDLAQTYHCQVGAFFNTGWDEQDPVIILDRLAKGEISEGAAAHMLSCDRIEIRLLQEQSKEI